MNRRGFLTRSIRARRELARRHGGLRAAARSRRRADGCGGPAGGRAAFTIRDALGRDPRGALRSLREIGIVEAELFGLNGPENATLFGLPARDLKRALDENGIRVPISHIGGDARRTRPRSREIARSLGAEAVVRRATERVQRHVDGRFAMVPAQSRAQLDALAEKLNRVGREYRDQGLTFGYHNHHIEFTRVDGVVPYDYLMSNTDPSLVKIELDVGWLATAGVDPVAYLRRHAGRVIACHLKDYDPAIASRRPATQARRAGRRHDRLRRGARRDERDGRAARLHRGRRLRRPARRRAPRARASRDAEGLRVAR